MRPRPCTARLLIAIAAIAFAVAAAAQAGAAACSIACENAKPGTPAEHVGHQRRRQHGDPGLRHRHQRQRRRHRASFKVKTTARGYRLDIYRMGYYQGNGARKVATVNPSATLPQTQPPASRARRTDLFDCGNWAVSASWTVPADAVSGIYFAKLVRTDGTTGSSHIFFVVREDASHVRPAVPDLRHDLAGVQRLRRQQPLRRAAADRPRLQGQLQPPVQHARRLRRGLRLQLGVPDGPLAGGQRLRRQLHHRRRQRPPRRPDPQPQDVHVRRPRRVLVGRAAGQRRGRARRRREPRLHERQRGVLEDPLGGQHRRAGDAVPHARHLQGDPRRREDRPEPGVDRHAGATRASARRPTAGAPRTR